MKKNPQKGKEKKKKNKIRIYESERAHTANMIGQQ